MKLLLVISSAPKVLLPLFRNLFTSLSIVILSRQDSGGEGGVVSANPSTGGVAVLLPATVASQSVSPPSLPWGAVCPPLAPGLLPFDLFSPYI